MTLKGFAKANTNDYVLQKLQDSLDATFNSIFLCPFLDGTLKKDITFTQNKDTIISHGLERQYNGFFVVDKNNFGDIKRSDTINQSMKNKIILISSANMVASIWVF